VTVYISCETKACKHALAPSSNSLKRIIEAGIESVLCHYLYYSRGDTAFDRSSFEITARDEISVIREARRINSRHFWTAELRRYIALEGAKIRPSVAPTERVVDGSPNRLDYKAAMWEIVACARQCYGRIVAYFLQSRVDRRYGHPADCRCCRDSENRTLKLVAHSASLVARLG
jgi:hypothetical protein